MTSVDLYLFLSSTSSVIQEKIFDITITSDNLEYNLWL